MMTVVGVRFKNAGKIYYFDPKDLPIKLHDLVVVETARGTECGEIVMDRREVSEEEIAPPLKQVLRLVNERDKRVLAENKEREAKAFEVCKQKIFEHKLEMKLVQAEYTFDRSKILFYFTAEGRVDFRGLVKDLAGVSVKMAKEQSLSLSPTKISGTCGRLMCCLKYEQDAYEHLLRVTPKNGAVVETPEGTGTVVDSNLLTGMLKVRLDKRPEAAPLVISRKQVKLVKDGRIKLEKQELDALKEIEE